MHGPREVDVEPIVAEVKSFRIYHFISFHIIVFEGLWLMTVLNESRIYYPPAASSLPSYCPLIAHDEGYRPLPRRALVYRRHGTGKSGGAGEV